MLRPLMPPGVEQGHATSGRGIGGGAGSAFVAVARRTGPCEVGASRRTAGDAWDAMLAVEGGVERLVGVSAILAQPAGAASNALAQPPGDVQIRHTVVLQPARLLPS